MLQAGQRLAKLDEAYIKLTLDHVHGNRKLAGELLGISLRALQNRIATLPEEASATSPKSQRRVGPAPSCERYCSLRSGHGGESARSGSARPWNDGKSCTFLCSFCTVQEAASPCHACISTRGNVVRLVL